MSESYLVAVERSARRSRDRTAHNCNELPPLHSITSRRHGPARRSHGAAPSLLVRADDVIEWTTASCSRAFPPPHLTPQSTCLIPWSMSRAYQLSALRPFPASESGRYHKAIRIPATIDSC